MKQRTLAILTLSGFWLVATFGPTLLEAQERRPAKKLIMHDQRERAIPNQYIVVMSDGFFVPFLNTREFRRIDNRNQRVAALRRYESRFREKLEPFLEEGGIPIRAIRQVTAGGFPAFVGVLTREQLRWLLAQVLVVWIEQDLQSSDITIGESSSSISTQRTDWGVDRVGFADMSGSNRRAFVIDTGVDQDHPDLNVDTNLSVSVVPSQPDKNDVVGHGTLVAGVIGAKDNNIGTRGVAAGATIVGVRVSEQNGDTAVSNVVSAVSYTAIAASPGDVVNISIGGSGYVWLLDYSLRSMLGSRGIYVTIAAGNQDANAGGFWPSSTNGQNIYTVSNMNEAREIADDSNYGNGPVDFAAPGTNVSSTFNDGGYAMGSGTSLAAPHVAGILLVNNGLVRTNGRLNIDKDAVRDRIASLN